jgi:hemolysin activation/secretion protein
MLFVTKSFNKKMLIRAVLMIISLLSMQLTAYGEPVTGSEVLRSQELIREDQSLRDKALEYKVFIKKIVVTGADLLSPDEIEEITLPFEKKWLSKGDIQALEGLIKQEYINKGIAEEEIKLSSKIEKHVLEVKIEETKTP